MFTFLLLAVMLAYNFSLVLLEMEKTSLKSFWRAVFLMIFGIIEECYYNYKIALKK